MTSMLARIVPKLYISSHLVTRASPTVVYDGCVIY
jgi:hypothetical protein